MEANVSPRQLGIKYGLILGLISSVVAAVNYSAKLFANSAATTGMTVLSFVILICGFVLACREFKAQNEGFMTLGQGFMTGFWASIISSIISAVFTYVWLTFIDPAVMDAIKDNAVAGMAKQGLDEEQIEQSLSMMGFMFSPIFTVGAALIGGPIFGAIIAVIVAAIMKKDPPEFA